MKEIVFSKDNDKYLFDFYFSHNAQLLLSTIGAVMVFSFTLLYLIKPLIPIEKEVFFFIAFYISSMLSIHFYRRLSWITSRKRLEINRDSVLLYHAENIVTSLPRAEISDVSQEKTRILIFPSNAIVINGINDKITILGFKGGEDFNVTADKIRGIILQKNQE